MIYLMLFLLMPFQVLAFSFAVPSDKTVPLEILAQNGMVCSQEKKKCTAAGPVKATKGTGVLICNKLVVYFQDHLSKTAQKGAQEVEAPPSLQNIKKIEALKNVRFFDRKGGFKARGQFASYDPQIGQLRLTGRPFLESAGAILLGGREVIFYEHALKAVTLGRSTLKRGDKLVQADKFSVYFIKGSTGEMVFDRLEAEGNVVVSTPTEIAKAKRGLYRFKTQVVELFDDVVLTRQEGQMQGNYGRYDMGSGQSQIFTQGLSLKNYTLSSRVQAVLHPKILKKKTSHGSR